MALTERVLTIRSLKRLEESRRGYPRFEVTFTDGQVARTEPDHPFAYGVKDIGDAGYQGVPLYVTFSGSGTVIDITPA
jgi:hypothetical protein